MPKEVIYGEHLPWPDDAPAAASVVELGWSREASHVQLATKCIDTISRDTYLPEDVEAVIARVQPERHSSAEPDLRSLTCFEGMYVQLDRRGINDLIRFLRRARDQAFGRDE